MVIAAFVVQLTCDTPKADCSWQMEKPNAERATEFRGSSRRICLIHARDNGWEVRGSTSYCPACTARKNGD